MGELSKLINIGSVLEKQLNDVGIKSCDELKNTGSREAWLKIKALDPSACIHRLYALEGAIQGIKKKEHKIALLEELKIKYLKGLYKALRRKNFHKM